MFYRTICFSYHSVLSPVSDLSHSSILRFFLFLSSRFISLKISDATLGSNPLNDESVYNDHDDDGEEESHLVLSEAVRQDVWVKCLHLTTYKNEDIYPCADQTVHPIYKLRNIMDKFYRVLIDFLQYIASDYRQELMGFFYSSAEIFTILVVSSSFWDRVAGRS